MLSNGKSEQLPYVSSASASVDGGLDLEVLDTERSTWVSRTGYMVLGEERPGSCFQT